MAICLHEYFIAIMYKNFLLCFFVFAMAYCLNFSSDSCTICTIFPHYYLFHRLERSEKWLDALSDPLTSLYTFNSSIALSDLNGDGDSKLIVADLGTGTYQMKLKVNV